MRPERPGLRPENLDLRPEKPDLRLERPDLRPDNITTGSNRGKGGRGGEERLTSPLRKETFFTILKKRNSAKHFRAIFSVVAQKFSIFLNCQNYGGCTDFSP